MKTVADVVTQLTSAQGAGFDVGTPQATIAVQQAIKRVAAGSQWIKGQVELGPTVVGQARYVLPGNVIKLLDLTVGEDTPYTRRDLRILWALHSGRDELVGNGSEGGIFAEEFSADGKTKYVAIFPLPEEATVLQGLASLVPADLLAGDELPFPEQHRGAVQDYATAYLYETVDENVNQAAYYEKRAQAVTESLFLLGNSRTGSGPYKIPVAGHRRR